MCVLTWSSTQRYVFKSELHGASKRKRAVHDSSSKEGLKLDVMDIPETQVFDLFQNQRTRMFKWMEDHPKERDIVLEAVERVLTQTGTLDKRYDGVDLQTRTWRSLNGRHCDGRFVPSMAVEISKDYRTVGCVEEPIDTEINVQLGNFTLKSRKVQLIQNFLDVEIYEDYVARFGKDEKQCAEVQLNQYRSLVSSRWTPTRCIGVAIASFLSFATV